MAEACQAGVGLTDMSAEDGCDGYWANHKGYDQDAQGGPPPECSNGRVSLVEAGDAPISADFHRTLFEEDLRAGTGSVNFQSWSNRSLSDEYRTLYHAQTTRFVDPGSGDWESHGVANKQGF